MYRTIKFRGKPTLSKWAFGSLLQLNDTSQIIDGETNPSVNPHTLGQFIGAKDRNGVEIYEGDIVDFYDEECDKPNHLCGRRLVVYYDENKCQYRYRSNKPKYTGDFTLWKEYDFVVLGNIHDNPELLSQADNKFN